MKFLKILCILIIPVLILAQNRSNISGYLKDNSTGEPLMYANVMLSGTGYGVASDIHGYYVLTGIPSGKYMLHISIMGYEQKKTEVVLTPGSDFRKDFDIDPKTIEGEEVVVTAERMRFKEKVEISTTNLSFKEIKSTPAFIEADVFRTIQQLPSVTSVNDFSSALIVRGGSPDENLILLDGAEIYNPYHFGGLFSTFNADAISDAEFIAGGFPAKYSGRLSSVLSITSKEGNSRQGKLFKNKPIGKYFDISRIKGDISLLSSKALAEGPFYKGAWILSGRRTYFDKLAKGYNEKVKDEDQKWEYYFWDNQFKVFSDINSQNRLTFSTFNGRDKLAFIFGDEGEDEVDFDWEWGNYSSSLTWRFVPNSKFHSEFMLINSKFIFDVDLTFTDYDSLDGERKIKYNIHNNINDITFSEQLNWYLSEQHHLSLGLSRKKLGIKFNLELDNIKFFDIKQNPNVSSAFLQDKWKVNALLSIQLGLRLSKYEYHDNFYFDPRFGFKYMLTENTSLKGSWGIFNQFLFTTNDENEVLKIVDFWQPVPKKFDAMTNQQYILGIEQWFGKGFTGSLEGYYKPYSNILTNNPNNDPALDDDNFISGKGTAWGIEFLLKRTTGKLTGWLGYSFSGIEKRVDFNGDGKIQKTHNETSEIYNPKYSKPHSLNLVLNYQVSKKNQFSFSWTTSSGQPYTPVVGKVYDSNGSLHDPYSDLINIKGQKNSSRYPTYVRGDIAWIRNISPFGINGKFKFQIMNVTNHYNVLLYYWDHDESPSDVKALSMFPIIPSFCLEFEL